MKVTIIYDNTIYKEGLQSDWGFSALIEIENTPKILFDTGANGKILLNNMKKLNIDPTSIGEIFISHSHFDHTGGLSEFLNVSKVAKIYIPISFRGVKNKGIVKVSEAIKIHENVFSTGELDGIEQGMAVKTEKGIVLIVGCSHPNMAHILDATRQFGKIYGVIGGLHGFNEFELFEDLELICPTHCTEHKAELERLYPKKCIEGGVGRVIEV